MATTGDKDRRLGVMEEDSLPPFVRLQEKKKQAKLMQKSLEMKEEAFRERMKVINCRWRDLRAKEAQLKSYMENSERILKENYKMPIQALKKASEDRERTMQMEKELEKAKKELEDLRNKHQKLRSKVQKYSLFSKYLEDVVKISQFEDIQEVIWRYKTLVKMREDLLQARQENREMSEQAEVLLDQYTAEKEAEILQREDELVQLQQHLDQARKNSILWETCWSDIQNTTAEKTMKLGTIKLAIFNLFQSLCMQLRANLKVSADDSHRQLDMIQQFIKDLADIFEEVKQKDLKNRQRAAHPALLAKAQQGGKAKKRTEGHVGTFHR